MRFTSVIFLAALAEGNIYLHSPRGSNNRLNENSAQNKNDERLFMSKNNRRGGYNVGDKTDNAFSDEAGQYSMQYFQSGTNGGDSILTVEWTNLVGCGTDEDDDKIHNCEIIIQSSCQSDFQGLPPADSFTLRNGKSTNKMDYKIDPDDLFDPAGACYVDTWRRDLAHRGPNTFRQADSIQFCLDSCKARGYLYAATQYSYECFCDNDFGKYGEAPLSECNRNCPDGTGRKCGGPWRQNVYLADSTAPAAKDDSQRLFFNDTDDAFNETVLFFNNTLNDTVNEDDANKVMNDENLDQYLIDQLVQDFKDAQDTDAPTDAPSKAPSDPQGPEQPATPAPTLPQPTPPTCTGLICQLLCNIKETLSNLGNNEDRKLLSPGEIEELRKKNIASLGFHEDVQDLREKNRELRAATQAEKNQRRSVSTNRDNGLHESWEFYDRCADAMGTRYGMECKNEREMYPYDSITPWTDVAYFSEDGTCPDEVKADNRKQFFECVEKYTNSDARRHKSDYTVQSDCLENGHEWLGFYKFQDIKSDVADEAACLALNVPGAKTHVWGRPMNWKDVALDTISAETCIVLPDEVECLQAPSTREGYLGNVDNTTDTPRFIWTLPTYEEDKRCVMRIRYIITSNEAEIVGRNNVVYTDGTDGVTVARTPVKVTYEDRSHIFKLLQRPAEIPQDLKIHNLVVRGKRGNIVQTYPAVEYDFVPNKLTINKGEAIHVQWTGSNTHNNRHPGGDGQTGDAGEGRGGTDRNNFLQLLNFKANFPAPEHKQTLIQNSDWIWSSHEMGSVAENQKFNLALSLATSGFYTCAESSECSKPFTNRLNERLDNAPASYAGNIFAPDTGTYYYKCMRNDNFSNRHQKGTITVV